MLFSHKKLHIFLCEAMSVKLTKTVVLKLAEHDESLDFRRNLESILRGS